MWTGGIVWFLVGVFWLAFFFGPNYAWKMHFRKERRWSKLCYVLVEQHTEPVLIPLDIRATHTYTLSQLYRTNITCL